MSPRRSQRLAAKVDKPIYFEPPKKRARAQDHNILQDKVSQYALPSASLMGLPLELRRMIHKHVLNPDGYFSIRRPPLSKSSPHRKKKQRQKPTLWAGNGLALLGVSKAVKSEIEATFGQLPIYTVKLPDMSEFESRHAGPALEAWIPGRVRQNVEVVLIHHEDFIFITP